MTSAAQPLLALAAALSMLAAWFAWRRSRGESLDAATRDPVTGLYSRHYADEVIPALMARDDRAGRSQIALVLLGVDFRDEIAARYGTAAVDAVLGLVGQQIRSQTRGGDIPLRVDDEHIAVCLQCEELGQAEAFGRRIGMLLSGQQLDWRGDVLKPTVSMGVVLRTTGESLPALRRRALERLDEARTEGANRIAS